MGVFLDLKVVNQYSAWADFIIDLAFTSVLLIASIDERGHQWMSEESVVASKIWDQIRDMLIH